LVRSSEIRMTYVSSIKSDRSSSQAHESHWKAERTVINEASLSKISESIDGWQNRLNTDMLGIGRRCSNISIIVRRSSCHSFHESYSVMPRLPKRTVLSSVSSLEHSTKIVFRELTRTLHEASMLCSVTHTAVTLKTGDHSFPRIEAHI
jgi:hypothetical protein